MEQRLMQRAGRSASVIGLGGWQLGADWGPVGEDDAVATLHAAVDEGVTFIDTADAYGDGRSETLIGRLLRERGDAGLFVATKMGRRADPHVADAYTPDNARRWTDRSRANLGVDTLDLLQLHCPPEEVYARDAVFDDLDDMVAEKRMSAYGVSVETVDQALSAIARPNVASVQIVLNVFRQKPLERVLPAAREAGVGVIARVPLASGLLTGKYDESETFAGVPFEAGVAAAREVAAAAPGGVSTAALALRWIVDQPGVTTVIPGARNPEQARANAAAAALAPLDADVQARLRSIYDERIRPLVHGRW